LIYFITNFFFWLTTGISVIVLCFLGYIAFGGSFSGEISFGTDHVYENFNEVSTSLKAGLFMATLTILSSVLIIFFYFKRFMKLVYEGRYFDLKTIKNLKMIAYLLTAVFFIKIIIGIVISVLYGPEIFDATQGDGSTMNFTIDATSFDRPGILIIALIFWVLSHIFMEGAKLKEANELTI
jgi:hypothetical protein